MLYFTSTRRHAKANRQAETQRRAGAHQGNEGDQRKCDDCRDDARYERRERRLHRIDIAEASGDEALRLHVRKGR